MNHYLATGDTYCNRFVQDFVYAYGGGSIPFVFEGANKTCDWLKKQAANPSSGWRKISYAETQQCTEDGKLVLICSTYGKHISLGMPWGHETKNDGTWKSDSQMLRHAQAGGSSYYNVTYYHGWGTESSNPITDYFVWEG